MKKAFNTAETILNVCGIAISMEDISNTLNLILLIVSVIAILVRGFFEIKDHIKNKNYKEVANDIDKVKDNLEEVINKEDKDNGENESK